MNRYKEFSLEFSEDYNPDDIEWLRKITNKVVLRLFSPSKRLTINSYNEFVFFWNFICNESSKRANIYSFVEFFDKSIYARYKHNIDARIRYSNDCDVEICKTINNLFVDKEISPFFSHIEVITSCYLNKDIDFLKKLKYLKKKGFGEDTEIYRVWYDSACIRSTDPKLYKKFFKSTKRKKGYMDQKYDLCISAIENNAVDVEFSNMVANSLITSKCFDLVHYIKKISNNANGKNVTDLEKSKYNLDELYSLCVLLVQKRGKDLCDIATSFLPKEYCTWILPFATQRKSTFNLKRRFGIK